MSRSTDDRNEDNMILKARLAAAKATDPVEKFRLLCLARGTSGISGIGKLKLIDAAFKKLDKTGDGVVTVDDLKNVYSVRSNPKFQSGEQTEGEILTKFLKTFEENGTRDGKVTFDEFMDYYAGVSSSIDHDAHFDLMMRNAWKL
ncbi:Calcyphosin-like protein [Folsomia candida]|uniref:Calcyphosin-like protein n=1 Tax=Folsomia candida TaxID=158441 RepID=A0A226DK75_FOLCA|nr:Calcyphosin-like protein [Folsomia candida]